MGQDPWEKNDLVTTHHLEQALRAHALFRKDKDYVVKAGEVIIVDANLTTPNISLYLGAPNVPVTLHDVLDRDKKITDALYMHSNGLKIIPASLSTKKTEIDYDRFAKLVKSLSGMADFVIIDSAAGLSEEAVNAMKLSVSKTTLT